MTIDKFDPVWAESGSLETISDTKYGTGWVSGANPDQPTVEKFNRLQNNAETKINEVIDGAPKGLADAGDVSAVVQGLFTPANSFAFGNDSLNTAAIDSNLHHMDTCFAVIDGEKKIIVANYDSDEHIEVVDVATMLSEGTEDLSGELDETGTQDWKAVSCCADDDSLYVMFVDVDAGTDRCIQAYTLGTWVKKPGWPTYGVDLSGTGGAATDKARIRNANATNLVVSQPWVEVTASSSAAIKLYAKADGTAGSGGAGDSGTTSGGYVTEICSNGTYVFFVVKKTSTNGELCSAAISGPTAGCGGSNWPLSLDVDSANVNDIACAGDNVIVTYDDYTNHYLYSVHDTNDADRGTVGYTAGADDVQLGRLTFDGLNFWALAFSGTGATVQAAALVKISPIAVEANGFYALLGGESTLKPFQIGHGETLSELVLDTPMTFDGRDVWLVGNSSSTPADALTGALIRVPKAVLR